MIKRIFIDNYKCFTNFECRFDAMQLLLGDNGSGKTTVFDVLDTLRNFITFGATTEDTFPYQALSAWDARRVQTFELELDGNGGEYSYRLTTEHDPRTQKSRIQSETLRFGQAILCEYDGRDVHLFNDDGTPGPAFPLGSSRSAVASIPERRENEKLFWFCHRGIGRVFVFSLDPVAMSALSDREVPNPDRRLTNLASWIRHLWQQQADFGGIMVASLKEVIDGLANLRLEKLSETIRELDVEFRFEAGAKGTPAAPFNLAFDKLSDGQRMLVALYTVLLAAVEKGVTVCLDEPDNFVSLRELQPWLTALRDRIEERGGQCLLISHHPEFINYLAANHGLIFSRDESGPARAKTFEWKGEAMLPAELIARGWE